MSRTQLTISSKSIKDTLRTAFEKYHESLRELESKRLKQENNGMLFLVFKPEDLSDLSNSSSSEIESFVVTLMLLKYKVLFEIKKGSNQGNPVYSPDCILRMEWAFKPDEVEDMPSGNYPIKHAYIALKDTLSKAVEHDKYGNELVDIERRRMEAQNAAKFVFTFTLGKIGDLGNVEDNRRMYGFILLLKAHGYSIKQILSSKKDIDDITGYDSESQFIFDMLGR